MNRQAQADLTFLKSRPQQMSALMRQFKQATRELQGERRYLWPADYTRRMERLRQEHQQAVSRLRADCLAARERLEAAAEQSRGESGRRDDPAAVVAEGRAWARILPVLRAQPSAVERTARLQQLIRQAGARGDRALLRALASELPLWLESQEHPQERARREAAGKSFQEASGDLQRLMGDIAQAGRAWLTPEEQAAYDIEQELQRYGPAIEGNLAWLEQVADDPNGTFANVGLVGWQPGEYLAPDAPTPMAPGSMKAFRSPEMDE